MRPLLRGWIDEKIADVNACQPKVSAQRGQRLVLLDEMPVDFQVLLRDAHLDAVCLHRRQDQHTDNGAVTGPQRGSFAPRGSHASILPPTRKSLKIRSSPYSA